MTVFGAARSYRHGLRGCLRVIITCVAVACAARIAHAAADPREARPTVPETTDPPEPATTHVAFGPYCGLRSLYAAMLYEGSDKPYVNLLKQEYLGSDRGSSLAELRQGARDNGLYAVPVEKITEGFLRNLKSPLILHVRTDSRAFDHYVVLLRVTQDGGRVYDPPHVVEILSFRDIIGMSDGTGLVISGNPLSNATLFHPARWNIAVCSAIAFAVTCALSCYELRRRARSQQLDWSGRSATWATRIPAAAKQSGLILCVATIAGTAFNALATDGLLSREHGLHAAAVPMEAIERARVEEMIRGGGVTLVDARYPAAYSEGHLPGAINVPVDAGAAERRQILASVKPGSPIIVYCQSEGCRYSDLVSEGLYSEGFTRLYIYRGGWVDWNAAHPAPK